MMKRLAFIFSVIVSLQNAYGSYSFSTSSGTVTELSLPWTRQGDTLSLKITIKNKDAVAHSVLLSLSDKFGVRDKSGSPLFLWQIGLVDSVRYQLAANESKEFILYDIPSKYPAGRFYRYLNIYEDYSKQSIATLPIIAHSALTIRTRDFNEEILADLLDLSAGVPEYFPVFFHNDSADAQVLTEFVSSNLPGWITIQNKYIYPLVVLPNDVINFGNIAITAEEPNVEKLEGPVYLIYKNGSSTRRTGISLYITSVTDSALLKPCIEFQLDTSLFGPIKVGNSVTKELKIKSNRSTTIRLVEPQFTWGDTDGFRVEASAFPLDVPSFGELSVPVTFEPKTIDPVVKYRYAVGFTARAESDSFSCDPSITFAGAAYLDKGVHNMSEPDATIEISLNPAREQPLIKVNGLETLRVEVFDLLGKVVAVSTTSEFLFASSAFRSGIYIVKVTGLDRNGSVRHLARSFLLMK